MHLKTLEDLFNEELQDIYDAEHRILEALPKMAQGASAPDLKAAFEEHLQQTRTHVKRLEQVFSHMGCEPKRKTCHGISGIVREGDEKLAHASDPDVKDAALIAAAQHVEHYEMASYGTLRTWANRIGQPEACALLQQTLDEEGETDKKLTRLAESRINREAAQRAA